jgi:hypothetical protein
MELITLLERTQDRPKYARLGTDQKIMKLGANRADFLMKLFACSEDQLQK